MDRRSSLPGVEELFGTGRHSGEGDPAPVPTPDFGLVEARAAVRQALADEDASMRSVRDAAAHLDVPAPEICALLRWVTAVFDARAVVEVGSAGGVTGRWILRGMAEGGILTSLEPDPEAHQLAAAAFAGLSGTRRVRAIHGAPGEVLGRLADASYDLVLLQADRGRYPEHLASARRLLRPGGVLAAVGVLPLGEHRDGIARFVHDLAEDPRITAAVLPVGDGLVLGHVQPDPA